MKKALGRQEYIGYVSNFLLSEANTFPFTLREREQNKLKNVPDWVRIQKSERSVSYNRAKQRSSTYDMQSKTWIVIFQSSANCIP